MVKVYILLWENLKINAEALRGRGAKGAGGKKRGAV